METSLFQKITIDSQDARKNHDLEKLSVLQLAISDIKNEKINKRKELSDEEVQNVLTKQVKQLNDAIKDFERGGREDLVNKSKKEIEILTVYLPTQMTAEELEQIVKKIITEMKPNGQGDFGRVMGTVMKEVKGRADGTMVQEFVKKYLG
ncbi:MAG: GatB/YqeY domain-containing protein [Patescibacteria group bacterium]